MGKGVIYISKEMIKSKAFSNLSGKAAHVLLIFFTKRVMKKIPIGKKGKEWVCENNGRITFYYREAAESYGISFSSFSRAIDQLVEYGFVDVERPGIGFARIETLYRLSDRWKKYDTAEFKAVKRAKRFSHRFPKKK